MLSRSCCTGRFFTTAPVVPPRLRILRHRQAAGRFRHAHAAGQSAAFTSPEGGDASHNLAVERALERAHNAVKYAEDFQERIPTLRSATLPTLLEQWLVKLKPLGQALSVLALCTLIHSLGIPGRLLGGLGVALAGASWGQQRGSLDASGAAAAVLVGWLTLGLSLAGGLLLLAFFIVSSKLTAFCDNQKALDDDHRPGGKRDWTQVAANGGLPTLLLLGAALLRALGSGWGGTPRALVVLHAAVLGHYACCCGDTWASEVGLLGEEAQPRLPWGRPVRPGVNGGITLLGTAASAAGGLFMGITAAAAMLARPGRAWGVAAPAAPLWAVVAMGTLAGLIGSLLDSILGATIQFTGYNRETHRVTSHVGDHISFISGIPWLSNSGVNVVSGGLTAALCGAAALTWLV